jgi:hypothetical protein
MNSPEERNAAARELVGAVMQMRRMGALDCVAPRYLERIDRLVKEATPAHATDCHCNRCLGAPAGLPSEPVKWAE